MLELYVNFNENLNEFNSVYGGVGAVIRIDNSSYLIDHGWNGIQVMIQNKVNNHFNSMQSIKIINIIND